MTLGERYEKLAHGIPEDLWDKYSHLSFSQMAAQKELQPWAEELKKLNEQWFDDEGSTPL